MNPESLRSLIDQNSLTILANTAGISDEESRHPSPGGANCFNWVLGHICYWRNALLQMAHMKPVWSEGEGDAYRGSPGERRHVHFDLELAFDLDRLVADFERMRARLEEWTSGPGPADLPSHFLNLLLHEAYHAGQLGILRRALGKEGAI